MPKKKYETEKVEKKKVSKLEVMAGPVITTLKKSVDTTGDETELNHNPVVIAE